MAARAIARTFAVIAVANAVFLVLLPAAWALVLPMHTVIHAPCMVRILVVPISLVPLALLRPDRVQLPRLRSG